VRGTKTITLAAFAILAAVIYASSAVYTPPAVQSASCPWCTDEQDYYLRIPFPLARFLSGGQHGLAGTWSYLQAIYLFGKETPDEQSFLPFLFQRAVEHDPYFYEGYYVGALMLGNYRHNIIDTLSLLERAEENLPDEWIFSFLRGYYLWTGVGDNQEAAAAFRRAAQKPRAPLYLLTFSATLTGQGTPQEKIRVLQEVWHSIDDPQKREKIAEMIEKLMQEMKEEEKSETRMS
jgi:hypothetical protein